MTQPKAKPWSRIKAAAPVLNRDYYCGVCIGRYVIDCPDCFAGCDTCNGTTRLRCEACNGGESPPPPPDWH